MTTVNPRMTMRLIFDHADEISLRLSDRRDERKASEAELPADERRGAYVTGEDPLELRPVRRGSLDAPLIGDGQGRTAAETEAAALPLAVCLLACAAIVLVAVVTGGVH